MLAPFTIKLQDCAENTNIPLREIREVEPEDYMETRKKALLVIVEYIKRILEKNKLNAAVTYEHIAPGAVSSSWIKKSSKPQFVFVIQKNDV